MSLLVYGIPNCNTVKKARSWLDSHKLAYEFHDYRKSGITRGRLESWIATVGWEVLLNRAGTTFRKLPDTMKANVDEARAIALMLEQPSMIKRPIVEHKGGLLLGFKQAEWEAAFGK